MKTFDGVRFAWTFRTYQQAVLDKSAAHLRDGHIHIVAAPGSGKTILGLELVRRLGKPALILAPSVTIRRQWGERFVEAFMPRDGRETDYISEDLHAPRLLTCVTYQALHAAMQKMMLKASDDPECADNESAQDFTDFDLLQTVRQCGIGTVCLDEAHHLRREWQKALEQFLQQLGGSVQVIALTATPPYDSTGGEWDNYIRVCGEVDEEIFVPQLVAQKTLCPHQDYVYFNMPTESEAQILFARRARARQTAEQIASSGLLKPLADAVRGDETFACRCPDGTQALLDAADGAVAMKTLQAALACVFENPEYFPPQPLEAMRELLSRGGVLEKGQVCLLSTDKTDKLLLSSAGKLASIRSILSAESAVLGEEMRALILTDYIRREQLGLIGTDAPLTVMGAVPAFEAARRAVGRHVPLALLSGTLVILPNETLDAAKQCAEQKGIDCTAVPLAHAPYSEVRFAGSNKNKVSVLTELFQKGTIRALVGTASLLGEGWDAPCINTLILASSVGSFMLTNQMRGRAIRIDKAQPDKASNIWHLVTLEPVQDGQEEPGADFEVLQRRFEGFLAPDHTAAWIENGVERLHLPAMPMDERQMRQINGQMLSRAQDRPTMVSLWKRALGKDPAPQVLDVCEIPQAAFSAAPARKNLIGAVLSALLYVGLFAVPSTVVRILATGLLIAAAVFFARWRSICTPEKYFRKAGTLLLDVLRARKALHSAGEVYVRAMPDRGSVYAAVRDASVQDKMLFSKAMGTMFSAIAQPRYVFLPPDEKQARAVPAVLDRKKEDALAFADGMKRLFGKGSCIYVRGQKEQRTLYVCRKASALNKAQCNARYKKIVVPSAQT